MASWSCAVYNDPDFHLAAILEDLALVAFGTCSASSRLGAYARQTTQTGNKVDYPSMYQTETRRSNKEHKKIPGVSRLCCQDEHLVTAAMGSVSIGTAKEAIEVPSLAAYAEGAASRRGNDYTLAKMTLPAIPEPQPIPLNFSSRNEYLKAMQSHTQQEFEATIQRAVDSSNLMKGGGWLKVTCCRISETPECKSVLYFVVSSPTVGGVPQDNFEKDPWSQHAVQFKGFAMPAIVKECESEGGCHTAKLVVYSPLGHKAFPEENDHFVTRVRSLGYVGSFLKEYRSTVLLLSGKIGSSLLPLVASPSGTLDGRRVDPVDGTFVAAESGSLNASKVPVNDGQRSAVQSLRGGLDIIVGPPGTGKSTTIWHIINSRVARDARVLVTCVRNQGVDAVSSKVDSFGALLFLLEQLNFKLKARVGSVQDDDDDQYLVDMRTVFGSESRLGDHAKKLTLDGRLLNDPELGFWREVVAAWEDVYGCLKPISWANLHRTEFPVFERLRRIQRKGEAAFCNKWSAATKKVRVQREQRAGKTAGRWIRVLDHVMQDIFLERLKDGDVSQVRTYRRIEALQKWTDLVENGWRKAKQILARLEILTRYRILTNTKVLLCTVDSIARMLREMNEAIKDAALALDIKPPGSVARVSLDTVILDEAACVLETTVPVILASNVKNLTLVGDQHQLQPFSLVRDSSSTTNHTRSFMERALNAGYPTHFLSVQYRMHPSICQLVSRNFYGGKLKTARQTASARKSTKPLIWVDVSGVEERHPGQGYSNRSEARVVAEQTRMAVQRYGFSAKIFVITFYNMQRLRLEEEWGKYPCLKHVPITSVDVCQGSDADVVIISTVRSGRPGYRLSGFMLDRRRINVALSRAREECVVVGDKETLREGGGAVWRSIIDGFSS